MKRAHLTNFLIITVLLCAASIANAATYYVATTGNDANPGTQAAPFRTIAKGINTAANGDTVLLANGTYNEHDLDFGTKNLVLQSQSSNPAACILDCQQLGQGILIGGGQSAASVVAGLTIKNGRVAYVQKAAGIRITNASPTISNCVFTNHTYTNYFVSVISAELASNPTITGCLFQSNGVDDGMVYVKATGATITNCAFTGNTAGNGGGLSLQGGVTTVKGCTFSNNTVGFGGGIDLDRNATLIADRCVFTGNRATRADTGGGAIWSGYGDMTLTNCLFANNTTAPDQNTGNFRVNGSSLSLNSTGSTAPVKIVNCTFVINETDARVVNIVSYGANVSIVNSIVRGGASGLGDFFVSGGTFAVTNSNTQRGYTGTGNITADPKFVNAGAGNYRLQSTSPCINTGSASAPSLPATDLDGAPRIIGSAPDMGAYELWTSASGFWFVDTAAGSNTTGNGSPSAPYKTVAKAYTVAANGHKLYIKAGNYGSDKVPTLPRMTKSLRLFNWLDKGLPRIGQP